MNDIIFNNLDRLLLQLVFQLEQASYAKEHVKQQIQIYAANIVGEKIEICQLQEDINKNDEVIISLRKRNNNSKENCNEWKPTFFILNKHEEYLKEELQKLQETTEKDKKMYQEYMNQYQETFNQHQAKYLETAIVQEYYQEKKEFEEIQNRILKQSELLKQKEAEVMDLQEPGPFLSLLSWASQIACLRQNTKETLTHSVLLRQQSLELNKTAEELEKKMNYFKQQRENIAEDQNDPEDQNHHGVIEGGITKNIETRKTFDESLFKETRHLLNEKHQTYKLLHLPNISQKLVQSVPTLKPLFQHTQHTESVEEKEEPAPHSAMTSMYFSQVENENQNCNDTTGSDIAKTAQISSKTSLPSQVKPFRLLGYQTQTSSKQRFETEAREIAEKKADYTGRTEEETSKDSAYISQDGQAERYIKSTGHHSVAREEGAENFRRTPEPNIFPKTPDSSEAKTPFELLHTENEGSMSKSPAFSFLTGFTTKSPGFNFFDSSAFGAEISLDESGDSSSTGNLNPISPGKIGDLFGKMDSEDSFAFSFPSCSPAQAFQDGKDDFRFPFAFGSSQPASLKSFQASSQSRKPFSLF
ncbi:protein SIX6OS1 [Elgaria multicarinata webbii]|uniref:protein SIX6OS1 n=1 Tax=Elgaria multicarinata webbii TaxID=159646 RepID=UPI002FCD159C